MKVNFTLYLEITLRFCVSVEEEWKDTESNLLKD